MKKMFLIALMCFVSFVSPASKAELDEEALDEEGFLIQGELTPAELEKFSLAEEDLIFLSTASPLTIEEIDEWQIKIFKKKNEVSTQSLKNKLKNSKRKQRKKNAEQAKDKMLLLVLKAENEELLLENKAVKDETLKVIKRSLDRLRGSRNLVNVQEQGLFLREIVKSWNKIFFDDDDKITYKFTVDSEGCRQRLDAVVKILERKIQNYENQTSA